MKELEMLKEELNKNIEQLDKYVCNKQNNIFSEKAVSIRKEIYRLQDKIRILEEYDEVDEEDVF